MTWLPNPAIRRQYLGIIAASNCASSFRRGWANLSPLRSLKFPENLDVRWACPACRGPSVQAEASRPAASWSAADRSGGRPARAGDAWVPSGREAAHPVWQLRRNRSRRPRQHDCKVMFPHAACRLIGLDPGPEEGGNLAGTDLFPMETDVTVRSQQDCIPVVPDYPQRASGKKRLLRLPGQSTCCDLPGWLLASTKFAEVMKPL
jgi:hypothetical protein